MTMQAILIWGIWSVLLLVAVLTAAFYSGMETGVYVLNKIRLDLAAESNRHSAKLLKKQLDKTDNLLAMILIGTNVGNYLASFAVSGMLVQAGYVRQTEWITLAIATPLLFVLAESVPKNVFQRLAERLVYRLAFLLGASNVVFHACGLAALVRCFGRLLIHLTGRFGAEELSDRHRVLTRFVAEGRAAGALSQSQSRMADRVMRLDEVQLADAMIPLSQAVCAPESVGREELLRTARQQEYSRVPLVDASGMVVGIVDIYDLLKGPSDSSPARQGGPPLVLEKSLSVTDGLYRMQRARTAMAVVEGNGRHIGIVTIKDLVEEIVGELQEW